MIRIKERVERLGADIVKMEEQVIHKLRENRISWREDLADLRRNFGDTPYLRSRTQELAIVFIKLDITRMDIHRSI